MKIIRSIPLHLLFLSLFFLIAVSTSLAAEELSLDTIPQDQVSSVLAGLSDEQVRGLLISELTKEAENTAAETKGGVVRNAANALHLLEENPNDIAATRFIPSLIQLPAEIFNGLKRIGNNSMGGFFFVTALLCLIFALGFLVEFFVRRFTKDFRKQFQEKALPDLDGPMRFIAGVMRSIPTYINILVFSATVIFLYFLLPFDDRPAAQFFFLTLLFPLIFFRCIREISQILCAPDVPNLRVLPVDDAASRSIHNSLVFLLSYTFTAVFILAMFNELQVSRASLNVLGILFASVLILFIISMILRSRKAVRDHILQQSERNHTKNWIVEQFAQLWHVPVIIYFIIINFIMINEQLAGVQRDNSAFLMSLMVLPIFVLFEGVGQWVVRASINSLRIVTPLPEDNEDEDLEKQYEEAILRERKISVTAGRIVRLAILAALMVWVLKLWGYQVPYATEITSAVFQSLIAMALGLTAWRFASSYIERKIKETTPEDEDANKESDDEFGNAAQRGRSYTLLPMLRKFIATTLIIMVGLIVISAMGVNIGPLLAGAGVVGIAIGFGAQKLVSDVLSGFFYLFDDAFRVGEYIQAGNVSGAVESITLRNVMLRHHRGMLQIVPHSDLGSITNFMRGGIIVKFNLEFPYDTDVDKVRKIIKKVGRAMLEDEEFGKDFINPVKSAGVREITASVMVIRVKFKAQPGTHFVIRREAYRRITDALAAQGIHYAHRKVIVELPKEENQPMTDTTRKALEAGAAAEIIQQEEEAQKKAEGQTKEKPGMPGM